MMTLCERYIEAKRKLFDRAFDVILNPEQRRAVFTAYLPLLALAGAGSGKTTVLVNRIVYLIKYGNAYFDNSVPEGLTDDAVRALEDAASFSREEIEDILLQFITNPAEPWSILAVTFTNKAAGEIRDRLAKSFDDDTVSSSVWAGTFHSICMRILRKFGGEAGLRDGFSIYDTDDKKRMLTDCMRELDIEEKSLSPRVVCDMISRAKDELKGPNDMDITGDPRSKKIIKIYKLYEQKMREHNAVDFDDIILKTVKLLEQNTQILTYYRRKFKYILVDEYQDTNHAQFVLINLLAGLHRNIMVVGDDDQSIYKFRGATVENILNFTDVYPDATVIKLEQNYRSTENILNAANAVIKNNPHRHTKRLWSKKGEGELISLHNAENPDAEGRYILDKISSGVRKGGRTYSDYAVLYRLNALGRTLQTVFAKSGIPYKVIGDMRFYDRKEVKDMLAYLTVCISPDDNLRLKRIINEPKRKIGAATVDAIEQIARAGGVSMYTVMERAGEYTALAKVAEKLKSFTAMINRIKEEKMRPSELLGALFIETGYRDMLNAECEIDKIVGRGKLENIGELISAAVEYETRCTNEETEPTAFGFLEEISLITDIDRYDENADAVTLMTIHAAKGLEFPVVFIAGMEDGIFPSQQTFGEPAELPEERRLAYVAITRAKEKLYLTYAHERMMYGKTTINRPSRFVGEIPEHLIEEEGKRRVPPRIPAYRTWSDGEIPSYRNDFTEFNRPVKVNTAPKSPTQNVKRGAAGYGITKFSAGTRVRHAMFGEGEIISTRDMGGDVLYEVAFDNASVGTKKLMATYAKLEKI